MTQNILRDIGQFSEADVILFEKYVTKKSFYKNDLLLKEGEVCRSAFYILSGSFYQFQTGEIEDTIVDLHVQNEWMFNHTSFINQSPSKTSIKAFVRSDVIELSLDKLHELIARSQAFLQFGRIFDRVVPGSISLIIP
jgi:CRP-like cAMP-binding protein